MRLLIRNITFILLCLAASQESLHAQSQLPYLDRQVTLQMNNKPLSDIFQAISGQTDVIFSYSNSFRDKQKASISCNKKPLRIVLDELLKSSGCTYKSRDRYIIINCEAQPTPTNSVLSGYVMDVTDSTVLPQTSIYLKQSLHSTVTNRFGFFTLSFPTPGTIIAVSIAKEGFRDTTLVVNFNGKEDVMIYLYPKPLQLSIASRSLPLHHTADSRYFASPDTVHLQAGNDIHLADRVWNRLKPAGSHIRNISDTLFSSFSVSLLPGISTNRMLAANTLSKVNLNVLAGQSKGIEWVEIGGFVNLDNGNVQYVQVAGFVNGVSGNATGVQIGGLFNGTGGNIRGAQVGGLVNIDGGFIEGAQVGGLFNRTKGNISGVQIGGLANVDGGLIQGVQVGGLFNFTKGNIRGVQISGLVNADNASVYGAQIGGITNLVMGNNEGFQLAGIFNHTQNIKGVQIAGISNVTADTMRGFQLAGILNSADVVKGVQVAGIVNRARKAGSLQLALLNFADTISGVPVGLLSFVKKGYHKLEISTDELRFVNLSFGTGVEKFYTLFMAGVSYDQTGLYTFGYGIGTGSDHKPGRKWGYCLNLTSQQFMSEDQWDGNNMLNRFFAGVEYRPGRSFRLALGPSFNVFLTDPAASSEYKDIFAGMVPYYFYNRTFNQTNIKMWVGGRLSLKFM